MAISETSGSVFEKAIAANFENNSPVKRAEAEYYRTMVERERAAIRRENNPKSAAKEKIETLKAVGQFVQSQEGQQLLRMTPEQTDLFQRLVGIF